jgi:hypothetical protein
VPDTADFVALMEPVALHLLGEPNRRLSSDTELRFGTHGSLSVDLTKGTWYDHEIGKGGGVVDLVRHIKGFQTVACMQWIDEFREREGNGQAPPVRKSNGAHQPQQPQPQRSSPGREVEHYNYLDEAGSLLYQVVRYAEPKTFRQRRPDGNGGWIWNMHGVRQVPYRMAELSEALANEHTVFVVEGEKDVNTMWANGLPATCNAMGAGSWSDTLCPFFRDADVVVIADNDPQTKNAKGEPLCHQDGRPKRPGQDHAHAVAAQLSDSIARRVRLLDLGQVWAQCPEKGDISDWFEAGLKPGDLWQIVEQLPEWSPEPPPAAPAIEVEYAFPVNEKDIPPRDWEVPGLLMRKQVTVLVAPSGSGKSLLTIQLALGFADAQPWANWRPRAKLRVLMVNSEDDILEQRRRFAAALRVMQVDRDGIADKVILADSSHGIIIAKFHSSTKTMVATPLLERLIETVKRHQVDWICVDPFAETFEGEENNNELKWAAILWREVARRCNVAVILVHHTKKYAHDMAGDVDAARGASALIGVARIVSTLFGMSKTEAQAMGVKEEDRHDYLRYDDAKANLNKKSPFAKWFKKISITLDNARGDIPGDEVGALEPWTPPGLMDGITDVDITNFMHRVDQGLLDQNGVPTGELYTCSTRRDDDYEVFRWVGELVKEFFKIDENGRASQMIKAWREANPPRLIETKYRSKKQRKLRGCVHSDLWEPPKSETDA